MKNRRKKTVYDKDVIRELIEERGISIEDVMSFDKKKIDDILGDHKSQERLKKTAITSYTSPSIGVYQKSKSK